MQKIHTFVCNLHFEIGFLFHRLFFWSASETAKAANCASTAFVIGYWKNKLKLMIASLVS
jgi:hypothetical protein